ncbi:DUF3306 domain-containing protein [Bradyrhizobium sp. Arg816]|uniref:DUF3306 domain-containing protein n=1 Tax=Bradyrhizobium sp. Arg816 TaxID=2998491 RepID=UPI00249E818E|nr:DUF3306 domain-containing protein [Bradyrhizobium sp. Arg816]MDI3562879.1 DUF3306 domain-containing protein [Bradyrhizobium sp. Arg816]
MSETNVFVRWARLKQASKSQNAELAPTDSEQAAQPSVANDGTDRPFDPASLPSIESIAAHTDIAAFLQTGVPAELTRLALRRAWATDPAIRDFVGIAENQWDFNDPNAIPGFGPLDPADNVADLVARMSKGLEQVGDAFADAPPPSELIPQRRSDAEQPGLEPTTLASQSLPDDAAARPDQDRNERMQCVSPAVGEPPSQRTRRHGSALPR